MIVAAGEMCGLRIWWEGDRSGNPPRTERGEIGVFCGERGGAACVRCRDGCGGCGGGGGGRKKGLYRSCKSSLKRRLLSFLFAPNSSRSCKQSKSWSCLGWKALPRGEAVVAVAVAADEDAAAAQPLTTACRSQSSPISCVSL
nr:hypothetical protein Itr_chr04CG17290 [Ipomoea trifida]